MGVNDKMEYVKKSSLGGFRTCEEKDATHILQTQDEYSEMISIATMYRDNSRITEAKEKKAREKWSGLQSENRKLLEEVSSLRRQLSHCSQGAQRASALEKEKLALQDRITDLEEAVKQAERLNRNLLRICTERSNADRNVRPKKQHDGYLVLQSREWRERLLDNSILYTWKSVIQTPYDASMEPEIAESKIFRDLVDHVLGDLGVSRYAPPEYNGRCFRPKDEEPENMMYCWRYTADYRSGYWSIIIYTINPLVVPPERRARQHQKRKHSIHI